MKSVFKKSGKSLIAFTLGVGTYSYYQSHRQAKTEFFYQKTEINERIMQQCKEHLRKYVPAFYLVPHGGLQQLWHIYGAKDRQLKVDYKREILKMSDGGQICLDYAYPKEPSNEITKVCMVFPGLSGSSDRHYVKSLVHHLT